MQNSPSHAFTSQNAILYSKKQAKRLNLVDGFFLTKANPNPGMVPYPFLTRNNPKADDAVLVCDNPTLTPGLPTLTPGYRIKTQNSQKKPKFQHRRPKFQKIKMFKKNTMSQHVKIPKISEIPKIQNVSYIQNNVTNLSPWEQVRVVGTPGQSSLGSEH